eukprot:CAMPEP_0194488450 /NCGR_PEP_ID=MMETSP0253-20130528/8372_1 /TAXON_ID=2966 /ORGANISM="Noctiluca scintillans" /LENGTH=41 /DNA_ID= /DNA_START= /DNA_END= /DNA_ORIENTATION=
MKNACEPGFLTRSIPRTLSISKAREETELASAEDLELAVQA